MSGTARKSTGRTGTPLARQFAGLRVQSSGNVPQAGAPPSTASAGGARIRNPFSASGGTATIPHPSTSSGQPRPHAADAKNNKGKGNRTEEPWFSKRDSAHPYELMTIVCCPPNTTPFTWHHAAYFPWPTGSIPAFVEDSPKVREIWRKKQRIWTDVVALCGGDEVRLVRTTRWEPYEVVLCLKLEEVPGAKSNEEREDGRGFELHDRARALTWAVDPRDYRILLCFGGFSRLIYVWDVEDKKYRSCIRGHGQTIMHLTTHPRYPQIIASSSRDRSTRITDLTLPQDFPITYADLPDGMPNRGNFPLGGLPVQRDGTEGVEGEGPGKCIAVLGWYVRGHRDAVVGADFHPTLPLLATCGLDHSVRIWPLPELPIEIPPGETSYEMAAISDPLFCTSCLHSSPLDSIFWLAEDILVSKSWDEQENSRGKIAVWQWTELDRFFPKKEERREYRYWEPRRQQFSTRNWDVDNSRLYLEMVTFLGTSQAMYTRLAVHHAFHATTEERKNKNIVEDILFSLPCCTKTGSIDLINPLMPDTVPDTDEAANMAIKREGAGDEEPLTKVVPKLDPDTDPTEKHLRGSGWPVESDAFGIMARQVPGLRDQVRELGERFRDELESQGNAASEGEGVNMHAAAIQARGARWIVVAGEWGVILIWRLTG